MNSASGLSLLTTLASSAVNTSPSATKSSESSLDFNQVLSQMLGQSNSSGTADATLAMEMLIIPLLEQLIKQQTTSASSAPAAVSHAEPQGRPVEGGWISQGSHPGHVAIDFAVVVGTPVHATMDGHVVYAGWNTDGYGNLVIVENGSHRTYYAHLSQIPVSVGTTVHDGDVIGYSGNTGHSTGPHLHYETRVNGVCVDPTSSLG